MASRWNTLYLGTLAETYDALSDAEATNEELRGALLNVLRVMAQMNSRLDGLEAFQRETNALQNGFTIP